MTEDRLDEQVDDRLDEPKANVRASGPVEGGAERLSAERTSGGGSGEPGGSPGGLSPSVAGNREVPATDSGALEEVDEVVAVTRERDEYLDALQRLKAEFDNYRKRVAREQGDLIGRATERLVKQLLPVVDDLERALEAAASHDEGKLEDGVRLVHRALADALAREGLVEIETVGAFDPHTQEALLSQPSAEPEGTVIQVIQKGYKLGDRVVRPARVMVSAGDPQPPPVRDDGAEPGGSL